MAAQSAIDRKNACLELCKDVTTYPNSDPLKESNSLEFYGQRPWRPGKLSAEPINPSLELEGIAALKYKENLVKHSVSFPEYSLLSEILLQIYTTNIFIVFISSILGYNYSFIRKRNFAIQNL